MAMFISLTLVTVDWLLTDSVERFPKLANFIFLQITMFVGVGILPCTYKTLFPQHLKSSDLNPTLL